MYCAMVVKSMSVRSASLLLIRSECFLQFGNIIRISPPTVIAIQRLYMICQAFDRLAAIFVVCSLSVQLNNSSGSNAVVCAVQSHSHYVLIQQRDNFVACQQLLLICQVDDGHLHLYVYFTTVGMKLIVTTSIHFNDCFMNKHCCF